MILSSGTVVNDEPKCFDCDDCGCENCDGSREHLQQIADIVTAAVAEQSPTDEPTLMEVAMRLGRGHYNPERVLAEIRGRDLFRSPHPTQSLGVFVWPPKWAAQVARALQVIDGSLSCPW